jgi:hypothetical protein
MATHLPHPEERSEAECLDQRGVTPAPLVAIGTVPLHLMIVAAPSFAFPSFETLRFATLLRMRWKSEQRTNIHKLSG